MFSRIVFWEPCLSPHKHALFSALARNHGREVVCCALEDIPPARRALGWSIDPAWSGVRSIVAPTPAMIDELIGERVADTLHIFSGIRWQSHIERALAAARRLGVAFAIYSEPRDDEGWRGLLRYLQSRCEEGWLRRHVGFVLAIGRHGPPWFRKAGYPAERIHPFAYFLAQPPRAVSGRHSGRTIRVGFVGRITRSKGVFDLVEAIGRLAGAASLCLIGQGEATAGVRQLAERRGCALELRGVLPMAEAWAAMASFDVLVLPSTTKDDGWGAVISEGLMCGCAVVASSCVGASILLDRPENGRVVARRNPREIAVAIADLAASGGLSEAARAERAAWARQRLDAAAGAAQLMTIIAHHFDGAPRPLPYYQLPTGGER